MRLQDFPLLTDENINPKVVAYLRDQAFNVHDVKQSSLVGMPDLDVIRLAHSQNRVVLTHDRDFGKLAIAALEPMVGIVYLRPGHVEATFTIESLQVLIQKDLNVSPPFIIVAERSANDVTIRVRTS